MTWLTQEQRDQELAGFNAYRAQLLRLSAVCGFVFLGAPFALNAPWFGYVAVGLLAFTIPAAISGWWTAERYALQQAETKVLRDERT